MDIEMVSILSFWVRTERAIGKLDVDLQRLMGFSLRVQGYRRLAFQLIHLPLHPLWRCCLTQSIAPLISKLLYFLWPLNWFSVFFGGPCCLGFEDMQWKYLPQGARQLWEKCDLTGMQTVICSLYSQGQRATERLGMEMHLCAHQRLWKKMILLWVPSSSWYSGMRIVVVTLWALSRFRLTVNRRATC